LAAYLGLAVRQHDQALRGEVDDALPEVGELDLPDPVTPDSIWPQGIGRFECLACGSYHVVAPRPPCLCWFLRTAVSIHCDDRADVERSERIRPELVAHDASDAPGHLPTSEGRVRHVLHHARCVPCPDDHWMSQLMRDAKQGAKPCDRDLRFRPQVREDDDDFPAFVVLLQVLGGDDSA
jgi:hypothetical protein